MGLAATYKIETGIYARYILNERPSAKIAVLYQNDDAGKDLLKGLKPRARRQYQYDDRRRKCL